MKHANGFVLWRGPSLIDGAPLVVIVTPLGGHGHHKSDNAKTGDMLQTWVMRADLSPLDAIAQGADASVCGDCPARGGWCYVQVWREPSTVWGAWRRAAYPRAYPDTLARHWRDRLDGRPLRLCAYGDPAAIPLSAWGPLLALCPDHTAYTHAWRYCDRSWQTLAMASVESVDGRHEAKRGGWRTFRVRPPGSPLLAGEIDCPAALRPGEVHCAACLACDGSAGLFGPKRGPDRRVDVSVEFHGGVRTYMAYRRWLASTAGQYTADTYTPPRRAALPLAG